MIAILMLIAIIIGYIRKGKLRNLSNITIKLVPLLILAFLLQGSIYLAYVYDIAVIQDFDILIHFVSYILLFAALMSNFDNKWFVVMTLGMIMNFLVIFLNGGRMPVSVDAAEAIGLGEGLELLFARRAGTHQPLTEGMLLWYLADIIPIPFPSVASFFNNIYSIGDFFIYGGVMGVIQSAMVRDGSDQEVAENLDVLLEEELMTDKAAAALFDDEVNEEEVVRLRELRKRREEETRRIFRSEAEEYFDEKPSAPSMDEDETIAIPLEMMHKQEDQDSTTKVEVEEIESNILPSTPEEVVEPASVPDLSLESKPEIEGKKEEVSEPDWKLYTQDFANASLIGSSQLEDQIVKGENYSEEDLRQYRKYYTKPLHERMVIDLESDGYDWREKPAEPKEEAPPVEDHQEEPKPQETTSSDLPIDTTHPFVIVDGRIVENTHYKKAHGPVQAEATNGPVAWEAVSKPREKTQEHIPTFTEMAEESIEEPPIEPVVEPEKTDLEELPDETLDERSDPGPVEEPVNGWSSPEEEEELAPSGNILQKLHDEDRINLMKKMKERKEKGYSLVQVKVGEKTITFWKKDL
ncbi:DUF5317 family protein [Alkalibacter rhizosphaerae]|uniref:DUF5317 family protein n=1 Tax=Alkalibacter rhizosphaerae TaxID=2815577 RepID=A0A975AH26_9FIRM|nr:DUF5317 domain-containing protein [Alkalibacter rhizosphaerae]QSX08002.1 DUF5317 family protein [Alkalibacter rhizosphaerae]